MKKSPASYGEILESTVPDPSGAYRPSRDERRQAHHRDGAGVHPMTPTEHAVARRVFDALALDARIDAPALEILVQDANVFVTGSVPGPSTVALIEDIIGTVHGVERVISELVVAADRKGDNS